MGQTALSPTYIKETIQPKYKLIDSVASGCFGEVVKCRKRGTREFVAIKFPLFEQDTSKEISILHSLMAEGGDQKNIVKFFEAFDTVFGKAMVFEMLDMSLREFRDNQSDKKLPLSDIRSITKQMATALKVLKEMSIIHADLKMDNILVCDRTQRPVQVKLADFGVSFHISQTEPDCEIQHVCYSRPPEVILGCPFDAAVDVWSLGNMIAELLFGFVLFPNTSEYETLRLIINLLGKPSQFDLDQGKKTSQYFKIDERSWTFMTEEEILERDGVWSEPFFTEGFSSLEEIAETMYQLFFLEENMELYSATVLLRQMLDPSSHRRITPAEILRDIFIRIESTERKTGRPGQEEEAEPTVIMVKSAKPENTSVFKEGDHLSDRLENVVSPTESRESDQDWKKTRSVTPDLQQDEEQSDSMESVARSAEAIMVRPAICPRSYSVEEDSQQSASEKSTSVEVMKTETPTQTDTTSEPRAMEGSSGNAALQETNSQQRHSSAKKRRWKNKVAPLLCTEPPTSSPPASPKKKNRFQKMFSWLKRFNCFCSITEE